MPIMLFKKVKGHRREREETWFCHFCVTLGRYLNLSELRCSQACDSLLSMPKALVLLVGLLQLQQWLS